MQLTRTNAVFSRTALVSRFLCRNPTFKKIPRKYRKTPIFSKDPRSQKTRRRWATRAPHHGPVRPGLNRAGEWCGRLGHYLASPFRLLSPLDLKTRGGSTLFPETLQSSAATENPISGTRNSVLAPCRDGELEEIIAIIITDASDRKSVV